MVGFARALPTQALEAINGGPITAPPLLAFEMQVVVRLRRPTARRGIAPDVNLVKVLTAIGLIFADKDGADLTAIADSPTKNERTGTIREVRAHLLVYI